MEHPDRQTGSTAVGEQAVNWWVQRWASQSVCPVREHGSGVMPRLLYTSDAADERSRVYLGGCRIL